MVFGEYMAVSVSNYEDTELSCYDDKIFMQHPRCPSSEPRHVSSHLLSSSVTRPIQRRLINKSTSQTKVSLGRILSITIQGYQTRILQIPRCGQKSKRGSKSLTLDSI